MNTKKIVQFDNFIYSFSGSIFPIRFIEGVGPEIGFYLNEQEVANNFSLLCKKEDGTIIYSSEINSNDICFHQGAADIKNINSGPDLKIYPIPAVECVVMEISNIISDKCFYTVLDSKGSVVTNGQITDSKTIIKPTKKGLYLVQVHNS